MAVTAGEGFDAPGYLRISYATSMDQLREGATRILRFAESLQPAPVASHAELGLRTRRYCESMTGVRSPESGFVGAMALCDAFLDALRSVLAPEFIRNDAPSLAAYGVDALGKGALPDVVVVPANTTEIADIARLCTQERVPLVVRGAGTGYTGGAVPTCGGVLLSMERLNRILEIDETNLLAIVQPHVITADLQRAVEQVGLFYPPDPASLEKSSIGGNVAECAGGPRAFKYGTTRRYVLALEAVLPTGEIVKTGSKAVKNVVGYDLTQLLVGSEGTLAIITKITLRLVPKPPAYATLRRRSSISRAP